MSDLNLCWNIYEDLLIPRDEIKEYLGRLYDDLTKSEKYGPVIKELYTREEYIETFSKVLL